MGGVYSGALGSVIAGGRNYANNLSALMGDSLTADSYGLSNFYIINANSGGKMLLKANSGVSGDGISAMLARVNNRYDAGSPGLSGLPYLGRVFIRAGTNNARGNESISSLSSTYQALLQACATFAKKVIILAVPPLADSANNAAAAIYNAWLSSYAESNPSVFKFVDDCVNVRNGDGSQNHSYFNVDGVHLNGLGVARLGLDASMALGGEFSGYSSPLSTDPSDVYPTTSQWFPNPTIYGVGGSKDSGFSGVVANSIGIGGYGAGMGGVCSVVSADLDDPNQTPWQRVELTAGQVGSSLDISSGPVGRTITAVDPEVLDAVMEIRFNNLDRTKISAISAMLQANTGEYLVPFVTYNLIDTGIENRTIVLRGSRKRSGSSVPSSKTFHIYANVRSGFSASVGSIDMRCITIRG